MIILTRNIKLYKYLDVNGGLMMLHNRNLQFTNATHMNAPFDCYLTLFDYSHALEYTYNWPSKDFMDEKGKWTQRIYGVARGVASSRRFTTPYLCGAIMKITRVYVSV